MPTDVFLEKTGRSSLDSWISVFVPAPEIQVRNVDNIWELFNNLGADFY